MMLKLYQVDAFAEKLFEGNPAAVVPLDNWLPDATLQAIAMENNLAETAYFMPSANAEVDFDLRWFTPAVEVDLCGHATLASAHVLFEHMGYGKDVVRYMTKSGVLTVRKTPDGLAMDLPARPGKPFMHDEAVTRALGASPRLLLKARDLMAVFDSADVVRNLKPDLAAIAKLPHFAVIVTAPGDDGLDFVSRFFAPAAGVPEDPVTGSSFSTLTPYWAKRLDKPVLKARQVSPRGGNVTLRYEGGDTVTVIGTAVTYLVGDIRC